MKAIWRGCVASLALAALAGAAHAQEPLQPYQMVRSLQLVQDRIAAGDHAALPMQRKLLEMIDRRFDQATASEFGDKRNFRAVLVYGMSGGNPATIRRVLANLTLEPQDKTIGDGIVDYLRGKPKAAQTALANTDPLSFPPELGAFVALVRGSTLALEDPKAALPMLDTARLLAPGTLVEEAALRRSVGLSSTLKDAPRFLRFSSQYVRRYLRSPYASQFADAFVSGVLELNGTFALNELADITGDMDDEQEKVIYLRIARRAAIDGLQDLSAFASARAEGNAEQESTGDDPRALLYSSLATVTSENVADVLIKLDRIDRSKLTASDRELLDAVRSIATSVTRPVAVDNEAKASSVAPPDERGSDIPPVVESMLPDADAEAGAVPDAETTTTRQTSVTPPAPSSAEAADPSAALVTGARKKLDDIDKMLREESE